MSIIFGYKSRFGSKRHQSIRSRGIQNFLEIPNLISKLLEMHIISTRAEEIMHQLPQLCGSILICAVHIDDMLTVIERLQQLHSYLSDGLTVFLHLGQNHPPLAIMLFCDLVTPHLQVVRYF